MTSEIAVDTFWIILNTIYNETPLKFKYYAKNIHEKEKTFKLCSTSKKDATIMALIIFAEDIGFSIWCALNMITMVSNQGSMVVRVRSNVSLH